MKGKWTFDKSQSSALKAWKAGDGANGQAIQFEEMMTANNALIQSIALAPCRTLSRARRDEACLMAGTAKSEQSLRRIHVAWRYDAFGWRAYLHRAEQLAAEFPRKALHRSLPIGDIEVNNASSILLTMAAAAVLGEDEAHDWFGNRCLQMLDLKEPFVAPNAWTMGPVQPFLTWLFCKWRHSEARFRELEVAGFGPFQCIVDAWDKPAGLDDAVLSLCDLHVRKVNQILKPDDDFIIGLAVGMGLYIPFEILYLQRIRRELGLSVPQPAHPFLDQPMAQIPFPCPRSGFDPYIARAFALCKETMPDLTIPWEEKYQADPSNTAWIDELDIDNFKLKKSK